MGDTPHRPTVTCLLHVHLTMWLSSLLVTPEAHLVDFFGF